MAYLLVKTKKGTHIRKKSNESLENLENVAPTKVVTWLALAEASHKAAGGTMEDVIENVINEMRGVAFKDRQKVPVTEEEYQALLIQAANKGVPKSRVDSLVVIVAKKKPTAEEMVKQLFN